MLQKIRNRILALLRKRGFLDDQGFVDSHRFEEDNPLLSACVNHGVPDRIGCVGSFKVETGDLLLWRFMRNAVLDTPLARVFLVDFDISDPVTWTAAVRVTGNEGVVTDEFNSWVLVSDDLDTRRCGPEIEGVKNGICLEGLVDDNKPEEDIMIESSATIEASADRGGRSAVRSDR